MTTNNSNDNSLGYNLLFLTKTLSSNDILNAFTTPVEVIPAPGPNKMIMMYEAELILTFNSIAYTGGGTVSLPYSSLSNGIIFNAATITAAASAWVGSAQSVMSTTFINQSIVFRNISAPFLLGNSTAQIDVIYQILEF